MKRGRILDISDCCVHVTQRCHNRQFLLKFELDRRSYLRRLRETARRFDISVLDYVITSNHIHLLLRAAQAGQVSRAMQYLQGLTARDCNRRKRRSGAFWCDRFNPTLVENGPHLSRCIYYIGLNMVRAGAVAHPGEWNACGFHELAGQRQRYRILDLPALLQCLGMPGRVREFRDWYVSTLGRMCGARYLCREPHWTEAAAVGSLSWIESLAKSVVIGHKQVIPLESAVAAAVGEEERSYALKLSPHQCRKLWQP